MFGMRSCSLFRFVLIIYRIEVNLSAYVYIEQLKMPVLNLVLCLVVYTCFALYCISAVLRDRCWFCCSVLTATVTRNSSGDEIANVNFLYDDIVHALKTIDSCINSATDSFLQRKFTEFSEITQCNGHYAVQGHSRSPILVPIES